MRKLHLSTAAKYLAVWMGSYLYKVMILSADCPDGWELKPEFGKCYYLIDKVVYWSEANERCAALDPDNKATLTSVRSQEENLYILYLVASNYPNWASPWIGGTDTTEEGVCR